MVVNIIFESLLVPNKRVFRISTGELSLIVSHLPLRTKVDAAKQKITPYQNES